MFQSFEGDSRSGQHRSNPQENLAKGKGPEEGQKRYDLVIAPNSWNLVGRLSHARN
jgi:hypothetical protein